MERRELDRQPRPRVKLLLAPSAGRSGPAGNCCDRLLVAPGVALGVGRGSRRLAQHIEGEAISLLALVFCVRQRIADGLAEHELPPENAHGLAERLANDRFPAPCDEPLEPARDVAPVPL